MATQIQKSNWRRVLLAPLLIGVALSMAACGKSGGKSARVSGSGYIPGCPTCTNVPGANVMVASLSTHEDVNHYIEFGNRFHATSAGLPGQNYVGPVTTSGYVYIQWKAGSCPILPAGQYKVRTLPANGSFATDHAVQTFNLINHDFEIVHTTGAVARVHIDYADFYNDEILVGLDNTQYPHGMYGQLKLWPVNAIPGYCPPQPLQMFIPKPF